ncbi:hypothetical protein [Aquimarina sp. AU474]|uniref:hypothetical protein n=1 Tax=Aquimarina sp. AU474 TaxID=2108529 RepID=UPI000D6922B9|nr:hypothetical protein [Aquimarina sp. AU474]
MRKKIKAKYLSGYTSQIIEMIDGKFVDGQIIDTVYKMQAIGFEKEIEPFRIDQQVWIKKFATKYVEKYGTLQSV